METPVGLFIFNRPNSARRVLEGIARAKPRRLLVVADGPRADRPDDAEKCAAARAILQRVDWPCDVQTHFSDINLGCGKRMASGIDWVFEQAEQAIILEDDCVPGDCFFRFCQEMLDRYRDDPRVMHVSGDNFQGGRKRGNAGYFFAGMVHCWGWATWRRAWKHFDFDMKTWPEFYSQGRMERLFPDPRRRRYWTRTFKSTYQDHYLIWDYQWTYAIWSHGGLAIHPQQNLVSNIGAGPDATHAFDDDFPLLNLPIGELGPLTHPAEVAACEEADDFYFTTMILPSLSWGWRRVRNIPRNLRGLLARQAGRHRARPRREAGT